MSACLLNLERPFHQQCRLIGPANSGRLRQSAHLKSCQLSCATTHAAPLPTRRSFRSLRQANTLSHAGSLDTCIREHGGYPPRRQQNGHLYPSVFRLEISKSAPTPVRGAFVTHTAISRVFPPWTQKRAPSTGDDARFSGSQRKIVVRNSTGNGRRKPASRSAPPSPC